MGTIQAEMEVEQVYHHMIHTYPCIKSFHLLPLNLPMFHHLLLFTLRSVNPVSRSCLLLPVPLLITILLLPLQLLVSFSLSLLWLCVLLNSYVKFAKEVNFIPFWILGFSGFLSFVLIKTDSFVGVSYDLILLVGF